MEIGARALMPDAAGSNRGLDAFSPATQLLRALRDREVSATELLELHLRRIERYNPRLNAIVTPDYDRAREVARAADAARARGEEGPLLGLPITVKDCVDVAGLAGTAGSPDHADRRPEADAPIVARARAAGAVIMGKTNVPLWAADCQSDNPLFGRTNNPWDPGRTPGGSSGGAAAAVAAGLAALEFGSDFAGSIRVPAAFCGVYGHRPSETALPRSGHFPGASFPNPAAVMAVLGPLARSAEDLALALDAVAGPEADEGAGYRLALPAPRHERLAGYRVAVLPSIPWAPVDGEIAAALRGVTDALRRLGARVREAQPEAFGDLRDHHRLAVSLMSALTENWRPEAERREGAEAVRARGGDFAAAAAAGIMATASDYLGWLGRRERYRASYRAFFREWDVLLTPANVTNAFPHQPAGEMGPLDERVLLVEGREVPYGLQDVYAVLANLSGQPATAFPAGLARDGLPVGLQAVGPYLEDRTPIQFAALVARELGGFRRPPGYDAS